MWRPLCSLAKTLTGPQKLIKKRLDKLLDFERVEEKMLDVGSVSYEEEAARHTYQALNSLLVAELPQFNQLMLQSLGHILRTLVALQEDLSKQVLQRAEGSLAQVKPPLTWHWAPMDSSANHHSLLAAMGGFGDRGGRLSFQISHLVLRRSRGIFHTCSPVIDGIRP